MVLFIGTLPMTINTILAQGPSVAGSTASAVQDISAKRSFPPDTNHYVRKAIPEDYAVSKKPALPSAIFVRDVVVSNTDPNLTNTDTFGDQETTIAINPANPSEIVITAFSGSWGTNAPIWRSADGGNTWTKQFTVPAPPMVPSALGCPCDQAVDYGRGNRMSGTFLVGDFFAMTADIYSGTTTNPASSAAWNWLIGGGVAQRTNSAGVGLADQPWLLVNRDPTTASQDNVYVAYDDFTGGPDMRVAVALGTNPPNFVRDNQSGTAACCVNPGHRLAVDPRNGYVYSVFQRGLGGGAGGSVNIDFMLNRSTDGGQTWGLNGSAGGIMVANADSTQPTPKFGGVNALLGGVLHATVDPTNGDVYYVYGKRDSGTANNRLSIIRLTDNGAGGLNIGTPHFVTGQVQAALPSVGVTSNGTVGVLYDTFDGMVASLPQFTAHFTLSTDHGVTFSDNTLLTFLSSDPGNADPGQRVLGDYQQVKTVGTTFYGVFTANGASLGRPIANHDPIFFKLDVCPNITCPANITKSNDPGQCGATVTYPAPTPGGPSCGTITCSPASGSFFPVGTTTVTCTATAGPSCTFTVTVNDTQPPTITCPANITTSNDPNQCGAVVNYPPPTVSDNCPGVGTPICLPASGSFFPVGTTTVTCTVADSSGNTASCTFTITVNDTQPPMITCPPNQTAVTDQNACPAPACQVVNYPPPTVSDNCPGVTFACNPPSGSCFPTGITTVTCTATDASGNTATCTFTVTTFDTALEDDSNPAIILLWNSITGQYLFCCPSVPPQTGVGKATRQGCVYTLDHTFAADRRVLGRVDKAVHAGSGALQRPPGTIQCTITDRNTLNDPLAPLCQ